MAADRSRSEESVLISAGASGIGRVIAEAFLAAGASVHVCDASEENIAAFLRANPGATATAADVSDPDQVEKVFGDYREQHDSLSILISNAGIAGPTAAVEDIEVADWNRCIDVDLNSAFYITRCGVPLLKQAGGGSLVITSSTAGLFGCPMRSPYAAAKWALIGLMKTWAMELGPHQIRVNAICPGSVEGDRIERVIQSDAKNRGVSEQQIRDSYLRHTSMRTFVNPQSIADMILFITSDRGATISGQALSIDGNTESFGGDAH